MKFARHPATIIRMRGRPPTAPSEVTERQREVARLVAEGLTNEQIAERMEISLAGAKYHVSELLGRLGLQRREEIAEWYAREHGGTWRRLRAAFGLPAAAYVGGGAVVVFIAVALLGLPLLTQGAGSEPRNAVAPEGPLPEEGWDVTVSPDYRDTDFIIAVRFYDPPLVKLIDPETGSIAAVIRVSYSPMVLVNEERRQLLVSDIVPSWDRGGDASEYRVLIFDLVDDLAQVDEVQLSDRRALTVYGLSMALSPDGRYLYNHTFSEEERVGSDPEHDYPFRYRQGLAAVEVIDLDTHEVQRSPARPQECPYAQFVTRPGSTVRAVGFVGYPNCGSEVHAVDTDGGITAHTQIDGVMVGFRRDGSLVSIGAEGQIQTSARTDGEWSIVGRIEAAADAHFPPFDPMRHASSHLYLPDGRLLLQGVSEAYDSREFFLFDSETIEVEHRLQLDRFTSWQPWTNGEGIWLLLPDGTIDAVDWEGSNRSVPRVQLDTGYDWWLASDR